MNEQWQELKETIIELRDSYGTGTQQEVCKFLANYMDVLEKQMQEPCEDCISRQSLLERINKAEETFKYDHIESISSGDEDPFVDGVLSAVFSIRQLIIMEESEKL